MTSAAADSKQRMQLKNTVRANTGLDILRRSSSVFWGYAVEMRYFMYPKVQSAEDLYWIRSNVLS